MNWHYRKMLDGKRIEFIETDFTICRNCKKRINEGELHVPKPEWGEEECEIIKDYQNPSLKLGNQNNE